MEQKPANSPSNEPTRPATPGPSLYTTSGELNWKLISFILLTLLFLFMAVTIASEILRPKSLSTAPITTPSISQAPSPLPPTPTWEVLSETLEGSRPSWSKHISYIGKYSYEYPSIWKNYSHNEDGDWIFVVTAFDIKDNPQKFLTEDINIGDAPANIDSPEKILIDGETGVIETNPQYYPQRARVTHNSQGLMFDFYPNETNPPSLFREILSTFRFLDSTPTPNAVSISQTSVDFASCLEGSGFFKYVGLGSTRLTVKQDKGEICEVEITSEVEGGSTSSLCQIPKSLGIVTFTLNNYGADFSAIQPYCQET